MKNILYLHGLESKLSAEKRKVLELYGNVLAPNMDYYSNPEMLDWLIESYQNEKIDCVIGSSMGGFMGYYVAMTFNCKSLLFNPALMSRSAHQNMPLNVVPKPQTSYQLIVGWEDSVVLPNDTLTFIKENGFHDVCYQIELVPDLKHQIPLTVFEHKIAAFFRMNS
jgi:hypothetical protein